MGEFYSIGLQTGKKVTEKVDAFIKAEHRGEKIGENFDPEGRKTLADGSTIYKWYMKWNPYLYKDESRLVSVLLEFNDGFVALLDDDEKDDYAYKLVAVGDEGSEDEMANEMGYEIFDGLYHSHQVVFPEEFGNDSSTIEKLGLLLDNGNREVSADYIAEMLMDPDWSTWKVFEGLATDYIKGNADTRNGINLAVSALTGWNMVSISDELIDRNRKEGYIPADDAA